ncbi:MAG: hypothetical protein DDT26_01758 [Dehalococcoidia bacterium]|nr:hypothetical protein [Chloroflexota bacterium]
MVSDYLAFLNGDKRPFALQKIPFKHRSLDLKHLVGADAGDESIFALYHLFEAIVFRLVVAGGDVHPTVSIEIRDGKVEFRG